MKLIQTLLCTVAALSGIALVPSTTNVSVQPTAERSSSGEVVVSGSHFASIEPYTPSVEIVNGVPIIDGMAWHVNGEISYTVDPMTNYVVTIRTLADGSTYENPEWTVTQVVLDVTRGQEIEVVMYNRIYWELEFRKLRSEGVTAEEFRAAGLRAWTQMER